MPQMQMSDWLKIAAKFPSNAEAEEYRTANGIEIVDNGGELPPLPGQTPVYEQPTGGLNMATQTAAPQQKPPLSEKEALRQEILGYPGKQQLAREAQFKSAQERIAQMYGETSRSDMLFALSQALLAPRPYRGFGGTMYNVSQALGGISKADEEAKRKRAAAEYELQQAYGKASEGDALNALKLRYELVSDEEEALAKANKPPRTVGTQVLGGQVVAVREDASGNLSTVPLGAAPANLKQITGLTSGGQPVFMGPSGFVDAAGNPVKEFDVKPKPVSATEQREIFDTEDVINSGLGAASTLQQALNLNQQAYEGSLSGWRKTLGQLFSSDDPQYVATETFDNLVQSGALANLKTMFGANPTEGERKIYMDLQAISSKPRAVREQILRNAIEAVNRRTARETKRLQGLKSGDYSSRGGSTVGETRVIRYDKNGKRI